MSYRMRETVGRRQFLKGTAAGSIGLTIAGCLGDEGDGGGGDAFTDTVHFGHPSPAFPVFNFPIYPVVQNLMEDRYGVDVEPKIYDHGMSMTGGFMQEEIEVGYTEIGVLSQMVDEGLPLAATVGFNQQANFPIVVSSDIDDWEDLRDQTIAVHAPNSLSDASAKVMVEEELGSIDAVEYQYMIGSTNRLSTLEAGEVDAVNVFDAVALFAEVDGIGRIISSPWEYDRLQDMLQQVWVMSVPQIDEREENVEELVQIINEAYEETYQRDNEELVDGAIETDIYPEFDREVWLDTIQMAKDIDMWPTDQASVLTEEKFDETLDFAIEFEMLEEDARAETSDLIDDRFW